MKDGFAGMALILPTASSRVPRALGLAACRSRYDYRRLQEGQSAHFLRDALSIKPAERGTRRQSSTERGADPGHAFEHLAAV
jgi:hypothetical protein